MAAAFLMAVTAWAYVGLCEAKAAKNEALDYRAITAQVVEALEAKIVMPLRRRPLSSYVRYYTLIHGEEGPYILGRFLATTPGQGFWKVVPPEEIPDEWTDGGCGQLWMWADFRTMEIDQPLCNFG